MDPVHPKWLLSGHELRYSNHVQPRFLDTFNILGPPELPIHRSRYHIYCRRNVDRIAWLFALPRHYPRLAGKTVLDGCEPKPIKGKNPHSGWISSIKTTITANLNPPSSCSTTIIRANDPNSPPSGQSHKDTTTNLQQRATHALKTKHQRLSMGKRSDAGS